MTTKSDKIQSQKNTLVLLCLVAVAVILCYSNSLQGDFQFDDDLTITENERIKDLNNYLKMDWVSAGLDGSRPVTEFTFALNYAVGGLNPTGYHFLNLLIHLAVVSLVYVFTRDMIFLSGHEKPEIPAIIVAGIFGLHPVQSESVSYISQRSEALASLFYLMSLLLFIKAGRKGTAVHGLFLYVAGLFAFFLGLGSKEIIVTLPLVYLLYDFYFLEKKSLLKRLIIPAPFIIAVLIYIIKRLLILKDNTMMGFGVRETTIWEYLMTQFRVIVTYLRLIVFPVNQNLDYDYPVSRHFFEPGVVLSFVFLFLIVAFAIIFRHKFKAASFGALWFFIVVSPTSSFVPIIDVIFEHRIYLAMWGIVMATVMLSYNVYEKLSFKFPDNFKKIKRISMMIIVLLLMILGISLHERNRVWQSKLSLWTDVASKSPNKARAHNNLGNCYFIRNDFVSAIPEYRRAILIDRKWHESYYNLAVSLEKTGKASEAVYYYMVFVNEAPDSYNEIKKQILRKYNIPG